MVLGIIVEVDLKNIIIIIVIDVVVIKVNATIGIVFDFLTKYCCLDWPPNYEVLQMKV